MSASHMQAHTKVNITDLDLIYDMHIYKTISFSSPF